MVKITVAATKTKTLKSKKGFTTLPITGGVVVGKKDYIDQGIAILIGKKIDGWKYAGAASEDEGIFVGKKLFDGDKALEKALAYLKSVGTPPQPKWAVADPETSDSSVSNAVDFAGWEDACKYATAFSKLTGKPVTVWHILNWLEPWHTAGYKEMDNWFKDYVGVTAYRAFDSAARLFGVFEVMCGAKDADNSSLYWYKQWKSGKLD